jgi:probable F420-dependent oxidoreductase
MLIGAHLVLNEDGPSIIDVAVRAEERGIESLFQGEHSHMPVTTVYRPTGGAMPDYYRKFPDMFVMFAAAAAVTRNIRFGTGICLVAEHNPFHLAKATATLDHISGGRLEFGVGYGWNAPEMEHMGVPWAERRAVFAEKLTVLKRLWTEDVVGYDGKYVSFSDSWVWPKPVQTPHPPILIGGAGTRATLRHVVELADGWCPLDSPDLPARIETLRQMSADAGKPSPQVTACYNGGRTPGRPWYQDDPDAMDQLVAALDKYQSLGVKRVAVGVPVESLDRITRGFDVLSTMVDRYT